MATQLAVEAPGEEVAAVIENDNDVQTQPRDYEAEARAMGWKPAEEFDDSNRPPVVKSAKEFVEFRDQHLGLKSKEVDALKKQLGQMQRQLNKVLESERNSYANALAEIRSQMREAVETGDTASFDKLEAKADQLRKDIKEDTPGLAHGEDPQEAFDTFREENSWYDKANLASASEIEINARLYADRLADKYAKQGLQETLSPSAFFAKIAEETEAKYPLLKAKAARQKPPSDVAGVTRPGLGGKAKTGANLPADAKAQATRFYNNGVIKAANLAEALDKYAKNYDWS